MKRVHIALSVTDIARSVEEYSSRLGCSPEIVIPHQYALWRTDTVNFSIRCVPYSPGVLRHLGWEDDSATGFTRETDVNGIIWEQFNAALQVQEINDTWPDAKSST